MTAIDRSEARVRQLLTDVMTSRDSPEVSLAWLFHELQPSTDAWSAVCCSFTLLLAAREKLVRVALDRASPTTYTDDLGDAAVGFNAAFEAMVGSLLMACCEEEVRERERAERDARMMAEHAAYVVSMIGGIKTTTSQMVKTLNSSINGPPVRFRRTRNFRR